MPPDRPNRFHTWRTRTFQALDEPHFRRYWVSQLVSLIAAWLQATALSYLVLELTDNSSRALAFVNVAQFGPSLLLSIFAGAVIDVLPKKRVLQFTQGVLAAVALTLGILIHTEQITLTLVMVLAAIAGTANAFNMPTRQSLVADLVPRGRLPNALALNSLSFNVSRTVGQALFGLVIPLGVFLLAAGDAQSTSRLAVPFYLNALAFGFAIAVQSSLPLILREGTERRNILHDVAEGLRYVRRTPAVLHVMLLVGGLSLTIINFNILIPYFAKAVFGLQDVGFGLLNAAFGVGAMVGALWQASKPNPLRNLRLGSALLLGSSLLLVITPSAWLAGIVLAACGFAMLSLLISANSTVQLAIPDALRGRVMALYSFVLVGMAPPGALISGYLISADVGLGPRLGTLALVLMGLVVVLVQWKRLPRSLEKVEQQAKPDRQVAAAD